MYIIVKDSAQAADVFREGWSREKFSVGLCHLEGIYNLSYPIQHVASCNQPNKNTGVGK